MYVCLFVSDEHIHVLMCFGSIYFYAMTPTRIVLVILILKC